ncbi:alpha/beta hydrolase [Lapidilactobacillus mulanensis]|uniref:Alpha/beta hydrolase n=1 Tax=Lapidilactobacillus mulanensis TaxID=2485999 RepID=A0ABW4DJW0_9LACO|nr:alpha/beta hydrolase [Lapidilactobacillus mulanensis]
MATQEAHVFYKPGKNDAPPILMLHGTGGDEQDLSGLATFIAPDSAQLGIRGRLLENGQTRYFAHTATGGFDLDSLEHETDWLLATVDHYAQQYQLDPAQMIVLGYSNGANVAAYAWLEKQPQFKKGILFHPMLLKTPAKAQALKAVQIWSSHGTNDPIVSQANFESLVGHLQNAQAEVTVFNHEQSHNINQDELNSAKNWFAQQLH